MSSSPAALRLVRSSRRLAPARRPGAAATALSPVSSSDAARRARRDVAALRDLVAALCAFGVAMVLTASPIASISDYGSVFSMFERQLMWLAIGVVVAAISAKLPTTTWQRRAGLLVAVSFGLLVAVLAPKIGSSAGGSSRWIGAGPLTIQPSELAKLAFVVFAADLLARRADAEDQLRAVLRPLGLVVGSAVLLILKQPDLGTALLVTCTVLAMCWAAGLRRRLLAGAVAVALVGAAVGALAAPYRRARLLSFVNPFAHASTSGYQLVQGLLALGSGHVAGAGVSGSAATWGLLPNAQTDFIFPIVGSDLGLVGASALVVAFAVFCWLGLRIAGRAPDRFSMLLATGITCWIAGQALINIGGVIGVMPETGIPLPFVSFGGSSLVVALCGVGVLWRIGRDGALHAAGELPATRPVRRRTPVAVSSSRPGVRRRGTAPANGPSRGAAASRRQAPVGGVRRSPPRRAAAARSGRPGAARPPALSGAGRQSAAGRRR